MTTDPLELATAVAEAAAEVLPSADPLILGPAQPGSPHVTAAFAGAALVDLEAPVSGVVVVLIGQELVDALADSPLGSLELSAALQPALDAAAGRLGARARAARGVELDAVVAELGGAFTTVPLIGAGIAGALLVPDATLAAARQPLTEADIRAERTAAAAMPVGSLNDLGADPFVPGPFVPGARSGAAVGAARGLEMLHGVDMEVTVELGRTRMTVRDLLALTPGAVLELDRAAGSPADLLVNGRLIARGEVVVVDEDFGLRVTEILDAHSASV